MFQEIIRERKKRELDPLVTRLDECLEHAGKKPEKPEDKATFDAYVKRVNELREFFQTFHKIFAALLGNESGSLKKAAKILENER